MNGIEREARRQQWLLRALRQAEPDAGWLRGSSAGLAAYRANGTALAERALAAAYPTLQQLLGEESFAALARDFRRRQPPTDGDIGCWGGSLPAFIADVESLAGEPYLGDVARLEWAVHQAQTAADAAPAGGLELLAGAEPAALRLRLAPGTALIVSRHPVATIWHAHRSTAADRFDAVRAAFAQARGEQVRVWRAGWRVHVQALDAGEACFTAALLAGRTLGAALDEAAAFGFEFEPWLLDALQQQLLAACGLEPGA